MLKTNEKKLVEFYMECQPGPAYSSARSFGVDHQGKPFALPSIGGITLNVEAGDSAFGWEADHMEPGVSATANAAKPYEFPNPHLQFLSCVGNTATILTGKAKGAKGVVMGHHGGSEHIVIDFAPSVKKKMTYSDKIQIKTVGQGLKIVDMPEIKFFSLDPSLLKKMGIKKLKNGKLQVPVTTLVPSECMGSGIGSVNPNTGDYDIMTSDAETVQKYKLDQIRFGDFVALLDQDNSYGPTHKKGAVTIGIVIHSDCLYAGHGPGVTTLMTCATDMIEPVISKKANIADILKIGNKRPKGKR